MSIFQCLDSAVEQGALKKADAETLKKDYRRYRERHANTAAGDADRLAKADLQADLEAAAKHKRRKARLAVETKRRVLADAYSHRTAAGLADMGAAFLDMLEHFGTAAFSSVAGRQRAITGMAHARMESLLFHFRRGALAGDKGRHNAADLKNVLREAFGVDTGDVRARALANPPNLAPSWGTADRAEWLAIAHVSNQTVSANPANYTTVLDQTVGGSPSGLDARIRIAARILAASSEDPGTFTASGSNLACAQTLAVH